MIIQHIKYFFTFISKSPQVRLAGFTTIGFFFFGWISYCFWQQHLKDDAQRDKENLRNIDGRIRAEKKAEDIATDYLNYIKENTRKNDSITRDNQRFINQLKQIK